MKNYIYFILVTTLFLIPILVSTKIFTKRDNDYQNFFKPIYIYSKNSITNDHIFPLWNRMYFAGTPLYPDPQSQVTYIFNIILLFIPIDLGVIILIYIHILCSGILAHKFSKNILNFDNITSLFFATGYMFSYKVATYIEAGHIGLIYSWTWIPLYLLALFKLIKNDKQKYWVLILCFSSYAILVNHIIIWSYLLILSLTLLLVPIIRQNLTRKIVLIFAFALSISINSFILIPQYLWSKETSRKTLITNPDLYPKWTNKIETISNMITPLKFSIEKIQKNDNEKIVSAGTIISLFAILGLTKLNKAKKILTILIITLIFLIYSKFLINDFIKLTRVTTRLSFIPTLLTLILSSIWINKIKNIKTKLILILFIIIEFTSFFWLYINKKPNNTKYISDNIPNKINSRVYCTTRCISQEMASEHKIYLIDGYGTLPQYNFYKNAWGLTGGYWNYYTLSIPPFGQILYEQKKPDIELLGEYSTKYILSPYKIEDNNLINIKTFENIYIYENKLFKEKITSNSPFAYKIKENANETNINFEKKFTGHLKFSEVYSPGWIAITESQIINSEETPSGIQSFHVTIPTSKIKLTYIPPGIKTGLLTSIFTLIITYFFSYHQVLFHKSKSKVQ